MTRPDAAVVNACGGLVPLPRSRRRTGPPCTSNDSWFGAAKTVTVELAQERRTRLLDRAIAAVIDQNAEFEVGAATQSSWRRMFLQ